MENRCLYFLDILSTIEFACEEPSALCCAHYKMPGERYRLLRASCLTCTPLQSQSVRFNTCAYIVTICDRQDKSGVSIYLHEAIFLPLQSSSLSLYLFLFLFLDMPRKAKKSKAKAAQEHKERMRARRQVNATSKGIAPQVEEKPLARTMASPSAGASEKNCPASMGMAPNEEQPLARTMASPSAGASEKNCPASMGMAPNEEQPLARTMASPSACPG